MGQLALSLPLYVNRKTSVGVLAINICQKLGLLSQVDFDVAKLAYRIALYSTAIHRPQHNCKTNQ